MKLTLLVAAALAVASLGRIPDAAASCAVPRVGFLPAPGSIVPPRPTIYVFLPRPHLFGERRVTVEGAEASVEPLTWSRAYEVVRVRVLAHELGQELTVRWSYPGASGPYAGESARYRVGIAPPNRARVVGVTRHQEDWTCSAADAIKLELEGTAIAYRAEWRDGEITVLPADDRALWPSWDQPPPPAAITSTELGLIDCLGPSVEPEALARPRAFELYALFADGSELRLGSSIAQLGDAGVRLPAELVDQGRDVRLYGVSTTAVIAERTPPWWTAAPGALGGAVVLLGGALIGRRCRRDHAPRQ